MKIEPGPQARATEDSSADTSAQAAVQVALDRRDNGGRPGDQNR
jgi:hypothetical protein